MIDPTPGDAPAADPLTDAERETRIEQLLVAGLDEYFAGRMDQAVNVWTRVLFLDRTNDRARAYIDRARRAQAERQRESEAMMHQGLQAFDDGDVERARALLTAAVERGAPHEQALPVLHRIGLLDVTPARAPGIPRVGWTRRAQAPGAPPATPSRAPWLMVAGMAVVATAVVVLSDGEPPTSRALAAIDRVAIPLPVPAAAEAHLARARQLFDAGKLPDALVALDRLDAGDAAWREAQALRTRIQRELLRAVGPGAQEGRTR
jgi:tetratricopeptide (TPR) repeat protein